MKETPTEPQLCYICAEAIAPADRDKDHVVPKGLFNPEDREHLITLPTHRKCNQSFAKDDEYFRLQITMRAPHDQQAQKLWGDPLPGTGPVIRGLHRPESRRFKESILKDMFPAEVTTESGVYLGSGTVMLQNADRILGVVNRMVRGLYTRRTDTVLPVDWPVSSEMMDASVLEFLKPFGMRYFEFGNGTFYYGSQHLGEDQREAIFCLIFYGSVYFLGYTGLKIREQLPWD